MTDRLFIYGTRAPGRPNEHVLAEIPGTWEMGEGTVVAAHIYVLKVAKGRQLKRMEPTL